MKIILTFLVATVLILNVATAQKKGDIAPDFTLNDIYNDIYRLSDNRGKVILVFLIGYNCPLCISSAPSVESVIINAFSGNTKFQVLVIDTWDGTLSGLKSFENTTNLSAIYLQKGSGVASKWSTTYDRLVVIDTEGKIAFKGSRSAERDADAAKIAVQNALSNISTSTNILKDSNGFALAQNYPNPTESHTTIQFSLGKASDVTLSIFDLTGKKVLIPVQQYYSEGNYEVLIGEDQLEKGVYFYRFEAGEFSSTRKMIIQ